MSAIRRVAILNHEKEKKARSVAYIVWLLQKEWEAQGIRVEVVRGIKQKVDADILFPQIDLSVIPEDYVRYFEGFPRVVNRRVTDIRKSTFTTHRHQPGDAWTKRVIVKTDRNYGGMPEVRTLGKIHRKLYSRLRSLTRRFTGQSCDQGGPDLRTARSLDPHNYPIFETLGDVPREVFANPALTVERFLQEQSEGGYVLRSYNFLGDRWFTRRRVSANPIVRANNSRLIDSPPVPQKLLQIRKQLGFDYGKFDFLMYEGEPILLDINTTPGIVMGENHNELLRNLKELAAGIHTCP